MRVLLDTNVIVDVLQRREPWFADGQKLFYAIANKLSCMQPPQIVNSAKFSST